MLFDTSQLGFPDNVAKHLVTWARCLTFVPCTQLRPLMQISTCVTKQYLSSSAHAVYSVPLNNSAHLFLLNFYCFPHFLSHNTAWGWSSHSVSLQSVSLPFSPHDGQFPTFCIKVPENLITSFGNFKHYTHVYKAPTIQISTNNFFNILNGTASLLIMSPWLLNRGSLSGLSTSIRAWGS